ncbi:MAG: long-chain fatty acid--CoA ligase [bacterium]|nr:long-chain fatty acid--CoA ligase [bacterium]
MFKQAILEHAASAECSGNIITDGTHTCTYGELPGIFEVLDDFFSGTAVSPGECVVFRCGNSLPEAVLLLWKLSRERDIVLLPRGGGIQRELEDLNLPEFCRAKISVNLEAEGLDIAVPGSYVDIRPNSNYKASGEDTAAAGTVYLRTSGSTAEPKLVKHTIDKLYENAVNCVGRFELRAADRLLIPVPIYHMYAFGAAILPGVIAGVSMHLIDNTNIIKYLEREKQFKPNVSYMTPTLIQMALRTRKSNYDYRLMVTAGDRINKTIVEDFETRFGKLVNLYGSTELGAIATSNLSAPLETRSHGIIEPMPGVDIRLRDAGKEVSEILCRHRSGFETYVDKRGNRLAAFRDGWFMTKDLGRMFDGNRFKVIGRTGNSINRSGILVAFSEVESLMEQGVEAVAYVVVTAKEGENVRGKTLLAYCQLKPGAQMSDTDIRSRCFDIMQRHMVPDRVKVMVELPRLPNGKFDRKKLGEKNA